MRIALPCTTCRAAEDTSCVTKAGKVTGYHKGRAFRDDEPKATPNPARDRTRDEDREPFEPPSEIQIVLEDAGRVARQRTFGTVDDTLDPVEICAQISRYAEELFSSDDIWSQDQVDEAVGAVEAERDEARKERDAAVSERKIWEEKAEAAGGRAEQLEVDLAEVACALERVTRPDDGALDRTRAELAAVRAELAAKPQWHDDGRGSAAWVEAHDRTRAELEYARSELELERERGRKLETFLESIKSQLRAIIETI